MNRRLSDGQARGILIAGIALLSADFALAMYSVPSEVPGLPSFPLWSLPFPLLSVLTALGTAFVAMGWIFHSRGSLGQLSIGSAVVFAGGLIWAAISFITAFPFDLDGITIYIEPYGPHSVLLLLIGALLGLFGLFFWALERYERRRERRLIEERQPSTQD